jgi:uncharacterized membrane protein (TIGR02234 family)
MRGLRLAVLLCLVGSAVVLLAAGRTWALVEVEELSGFHLRSAYVTGELAAPGLRPLALVGLAGTVALVAARGWLRVLVGVLLLAAGVSVVALAIGNAGGVADVTPAVDPVKVARVSHTAWRWVAMVGGALLGAAGALAALRGRHWTGLSQAYETPAARAGQEPVTDKGVWDALDRGEDPTA